MGQSYSHVTLAIPITATDHSIGPTRGHTTLVEYGDFESPRCESMEPAIRILRAHYPHSLRFIYRHFPDEEAHCNALQAAEAAEAAAAQGRFWGMHQVLVNNPRRLTRRYLDEYADSLNLDLARFRAELDDAVYRQRIREHQKGARLCHLLTAPGFFVDGDLIDMQGGMHLLYRAVRIRILRNISDGRR